MHRLVAQLTACLTRVSNVQELWVRVEEIRVEAYQQSNQSHEETLMEVSLPVCLSIAG